jgi:hypothetical protein
MESQSAEVGRIDRENEQLRTMLHALLQAIEAGGRDGLAETLQELESKASALTDDGAAEAPVAAEIAEPLAEFEDPGAETPTETMAQIDEPIDEPIDEHQTEESVGEAEVPIADGPAEPVAEAEERVAEAPVESAADIEALESETPAEIGEAVAEAPVVADGAIAPGDVLDTAEFAGDSEGEIAAPREVPAAEAEGAVDEDAGSGSLDEIMARVSRLVQETEAAIAAPEPAAETPEDPAGEPAAQAAAGS